jgi:hypothetical protein
MIVNVETTFGAVSGNKPDVFTQSTIPGRGEEGSSGTGPRWYPIGTSTHWYWGAGRSRSLLNLADGSHSDDILALALASENICETSPRAGCKSAPPDAGTRDGHHFRPT